MQSVALIFCFPGYSTIIPFMLLPVLNSIRFLCSVSQYSSSFIAHVLYTAKIRCTKREKRCLLLPCPRRAAFDVYAGRSPDPIIITILYCAIEKHYTVHLLRILNIAADEIRKTFIELNAFKKRTVTLITFHKIIHRLKNIIHVVRILYIDYIAVRG